MTQHLRHLHFTQSLEPLQGAGLGYSALGLHQGLLENASFSQLAATHGSGFGESWPHVNLYARKGIEKTFYAPGMKNTARTLVKSSNIVHAHGFYVAPNWLIGSEARRQRKPLVHHVQGFLDPWILARSRFKKRIAHFLFESANFRHASLWRAVSLKEEQQIRDFGVKAPVIVLPNGVKLPVERSAAELAEFAAKFPRTGKRRAIFLSRIHSKKGLDLLIPAWTGLPTELTCDWELLLFGPDEGGYASQVAGWIEQAGLGKAVKLMGSVSGAAKEAAFRSADLFVLPSYSEGFPMAVLEASSYGLPVVQTSECNFPELTAAQGAWECVPTLEGLTKSLRMALACDDSERHQRGEAGYQLVCEHYSWSSIALRLHEACQTLV